MSLILYKTDSGVITLADVLNQPNFRRPKDAISTRPKDLPKKLTSGDIDDTAIYAALSNSGIKYIMNRNWDKCAPPMRKPRNMPRTMYDTAIKNGGTVYDIKASSSKWNKPTTYQTTPSVMRASISALQTLNSLALEDATMAKLRTEAEEVATNTYFGNASRMGQLVRLIKVKKAWNYANKHYEEHTIDIRKNYMSFAETDLRFPCTLAEINLTRKEALEKKVMPIRINLTAESGPPLPAKIKRKDTAVNDLFQYEDLFDVDNPNIRSLAKTCHMKPKREVYDVIDAEKKVRNLFVYNSLTSLPFLCLAQMAGMFMNKSSNNLLGLKITNGYPDTLIKEMINTPGSQYVFSDNLFLAIKGVVRSMDGVKMEASHANPGRMAQLIDILLTELDPSGEMIPNKVRRYLERAPEMYTNSPTIFDKIMFEGLGLGTGCPLTMLMNHMAMSECATLLRKQYDMSTLIDDINETIKHTGVQLEDTRTTNLNGMKNAEIREPDFLGYAVILWEGKYYMILERKRIIKAILYDKNEYSDMHPRVKQLRQLRNEMQKMVTLYLAGGWAHPDITQYLKTRFEDVKRTPEVLSTEPDLDEEGSQVIGDEIMQEISKMTEFPSLIWALSKLNPKEKTEAPASVDTKIPKVHFAPSRKRKQTDDDKKETVNVPGKIFKHTPRWDYDLTKLFK